MGQSFENVADVETCVIGIHVPSQQQPRPESAAALLFLC